MSHPKISESVAEAPEANSDLTPIYPIDSNSYQPENLPPIAARSHTITPEKKQFRWPFILIMMAIITAIGGGWAIWQLTQNRPQQQALAAKPKAIPVKLTTIESSLLQDSSEFVSSLEAKRSVEIKPQIDGLVTEIFAKSGDFVEAGQAIARMKSDSAQADLKQSQANLIRAQSRLSELQAGTRPEEIAQAKARVDQAEANLAQLRSGSRPEEIAQAQAKVSQADADLADAKSGSLVEEIAQAKAQVESNKAEAELANQQLARYQELVKEGAESENTLQQYIQKNSSAQANLKEAQRRLDQRQKNRKAEIERRTAALKQQQEALQQLQNGTRKEEIDKAEAQVAEAKGRLAELANGTRQEQIDQAEAQVAEAAAQLRGFEVQLQDTAIVAPFSGVIGDVPIKVGDYLKKGDLLTALTENQLLDLRLSIPLERQGELRLGLPVEMLDNQGKTIAKGQISFISPNVSANSQTILAKATFSNSQGELRNLQFVKAKVIWKQNPGILVPVIAISRLGGETFVFTAEKVEKPEPEMPPLIVRQKSIKLGSIQGNNYQVIEGLKAGEKVVVAGILNLSDGAAIMPQAAEEEAGKKLPSAGKN